MGCLIDLKPAFFFFSYLTSHQKLSLFIPNSSGIKKLLRIIIIVFENFLHLHLIWTWILCLDLLWIMFVWWLALWFFSVSNKFFCFKTEAEEGSYLPTTLCLIKLFLQALHYLCNGIWFIGFNLTYYAPCFAS